MTKYYYLGYWIYKMEDDYVCQIDNSFHKSLTSAKAHIDYLTK